MDLTMFLSNCISYLYLLLVKLLNFFLPEKLYYFFLKKISNFYFINDYYVYIYKYMTNFFIPVWKRALTTLLVDINYLLELIYPYINFDFFMENIVIFFSKDNFLLLFLKKMYLCIMGDLAYALRFDIPFFEKDWTFFGTFFLIISFIYALVLYKRFLKLTGIFYMMSDSVKYILGLNPEDNLLIYFSNYKILSPFILLYCHWMNFYCRVYAGLRNIPEWDLKVFKKLLSIKYTMHKYGMYKYFAFFMLKNDHKFHVDKNKFFQKNNFHLIKEFIIKLRNYFDLLSRIRRFNSKNKIKNKDINPYKYIDPIKKKEYNYSEEFYSNFLEKKNYNIFFKKGIKNKMFYIVKNKQFNKGRYSRNRQLYRTGVYWCIWLNILALYGLFYLFYGFIFNFTYLYAILITYLFVCVVLVFKKLKNIT